MHSSTLALAAVAGFSGLAIAANATQWRGLSMYQVVVDRFARTEGDTTSTCDDALLTYCGGTWKGLESQLDYIQGMGFTAIQISPVVHNIENNTAVGDAYHGYWQDDLYSLNEHFGTESDLQDLVKAVHDRGMYIMVDTVINDMAQAFNNVYPPPLDYADFTPFDSESFFHTYCNVTDWDNSTDYQDCWLYPTDVALADLDTESTAVVSAMTTWITSLIGNYSFDGIRIDAAKHVDDAFLPQYTKASGVFAMGEVLTGVVDDMCRYQTKGLLTGMENYLDYYQLLTAFNGGSMSEMLAPIRSQSETGCNDTTVLTTFVENHDMPRFASVVEDMAIAKNALTYVILNDGIPLVYYGQEQHFTGSGTPQNRGPMWVSDYNTSAPLYNLTATLNKVRNLAVNASDEYAATTSSQLFTDVNHLCLSKGPKGSQIVTCVNNKASGGDTYQMSLGGFQPSENITEVTTCTTVTADATGNFTGYFYSGEPRVWVLSSFLESSGLCPTTTDAASASSSQQSGAGRMAAVGVANAAFAALVMGWALMFLA